MSSPLLTGVVDPPRPGGRPSWYSETAPSPLAVEVIDARWHGFGGWDRALRVLPDGCADVIWDGRRLFAVGVHPEPLRFTVDAASHNVGVRLRPGVAGAVLGVPMSELPRNAVELDELWGPSVREIEERLGSAPGQRAQHELLERCVVERLTSGSSEPDRTVIAAADLLRRPSSSIDATARAVGLSPRELRRRFLLHVGYGPKTLQRVLRFRAFLHGGPRAVDATSAGSDALADLAVRSGYADQSHLGRECRRLAGSSPRRLMRQRRRPGGAVESGRNVPDPGGASGAR